MLLPATTGLGDAELLTTICAPAVVPTSVNALAVLLLVLGSLTEELATAVSVITVPLATPVLTLTAMENVAAVLAAMFRSVQTILPVPPSTGVLHVHPDGAEIEAKTVLAGMLSLMVALSAALGPLFVTICV